MFTIVWRVGLETKTVPKAERVLRRVELQLGMDATVANIERETYHPELIGYRAELVSLLDIDDQCPALAVYETLKIIDRLGEHWLVTAPRDDGVPIWWGQRGNGSTESSFSIPGVLSVDFALYRAWPIENLVDNG